MIIILDILLFKVIHSLLTLEIILYLFIILSILDDYSESRIRAS